MEWWMWIVVVIAALFLLVLLIELPSIRRYRRLTSM